MSGQGARGRPKGGRGALPTRRARPPGRRTGDDDGGFSEARRQARATFQRRRDHLLALIRNDCGLPCVTPDGAFYTMVDVRDYGSSVEVAEAMLNAGVVTVPGNAFGSEGEGFLRISFCADLPMLTEGVKRMATALKVLKRNIQ